MDKLKKSITTKLVFAILLTIFFPVGIVAICMGAGKSTLVLILGIIGVVFGFYGAPILWINYANQKSLLRILDLILNENLYTVSDIASQIAQNENVVTQNINTLIVQGYLKGYIFKDGVLYLNTNKKQTAKNVDKIKCDSCGGQMVFDGVKYVCEYCSSTKEKK